MRPVTVETNLRQRRRRRRQREKQIINLWSAQQNSVDSSRGRLGRFEFAFVAFSNRFFADAFTISACVRVIQRHVSRRHGRDRSQHPRTYKFFAAITDENELVLFCFLLCMLLIRFRVGQCHSMPHTYTQTDNSNSPLSLMRAISCASSA